MLCHIILAIIYEYILIYSHLGLYHLDLPRILNVKYELLTQFGSTEDGELPEKIETDPFTT